MELDVERLEPPQDGKTDSTSGYSSDMHPLKIVGAGDTIRDIPSPVHGAFVRWKVVANQLQDHHHRVLGDANAVRVGFLSNGDAGCRCRRQIDMIWSDTGRDRKLELLRL